MVNLPDVMKDIDYLTGTDGNFRRQRREAMLRGQRLHSSEDMPLQFSPQDQRKTIVTEHFRGIMLTVEAIRLDSATKNQVLNIIRTHLHDWLDWVENQNPTDSEVQSTLPREEQYLQENFRLNI